MYVEYSAAQRELRTELRAYLDALMTPELLAELAATEAGGPRYREALAKLGADKWLGVGWPSEYGGRGMSAIEQYIFSDEVLRARFPFPSLTINTVGPTLLEYGTDEQRQAFLHKMLAGECLFSIGYTEPSAGTDLASLRTTAVRDGDEWVINGQKVFTSLVDHADYVWLAARTDPEAPKHKGISIFIVPTTADGFSMTPTNTLGDNACATTYYEDLRVPTAAMVGPENKGWRLIMTQLNHERVSLMTVGMVKRALEEVTDWARATGRIESGWVRRNLAKVRADVEVLELLNWRQAWRMTRGKLDPAEASCVKVFGSELYIRDFRLLMEVSGVQGAIAAGSPGAILGGKLERYYRALTVLTFGAGTNEVQRDIIATVGLRMPRAM